MMTIALAPSGSSTFANNSKTLCTLPDRGKESVRPGRSVSTVLHARVNNLTNKVEFGN
ncbi:unnamed protein product [Schistosoma curassoni]|uniref:Kinesin motor domain-containing protein n=1 Tax=Schistosoma curassoni TaxID=6186 RepID=A0A183JEQ9_9TREM|nr:unnamed protein product [Schistosoma curassoni]